MLARERRDHIVIDAGIHEQRRGPISYQDGIRLADVEHGYGGRCRKPPPDRPSHDQHEERAGERGQTTGAPHPPGTCVNKGRPRVADEQRGR